MRVGVSAHITIADMLSHRTGIKGRDILWLWQPGALSRNQLAARFAACPQDLPFRSAWNYNNLMYLAAGQIIPAVIGKSRDWFIHERIFAPLGMDASNTSVTALVAKETWPDRTSWTMARS